MTAKRRIHLDYNAATPADPRVLERFVEVEQGYPANPGSLHTSGRAAGSILEEAREQVADAFDCDPEHVLFVSGGTEANNLALLELGAPDRVVLTSAAEHPSVFEAAEQRGRRDLGVDEFGRVRFGDEDVDGEGVGLIALVHGQNEIGVIQPVERAAELAKRLGVPLHVDLAQTLGRVDVAAVLSLADTVAVSPHKHGGLAGHGILAGPGVAQLRRGRLFGGAQEFGKRAGTPSPALSAANALAVELALSEREERARAMRDARDTFLAGITSVAQSLTSRVESAEDACGVVGERTLPNTIMCRFEGVDGRSLLPALDIAGVEASAGSACSAGSPEPPRVLRAMGLNEEAARQCLRFSVSHTTSVPEVEEAAQRVIHTAVRLGSLGAR